ncbi:DMT family transporter [Agrococcus terreus]|uniref:EamA family transporter n=1 Tax=Agrococcus terreus TaxID=574649 RepID=UPI00384D78BD
METNGTLRWTLVGALAPVLWGSVYFVTSHWIPAGEPLTAALLRALPAGIVLLLWRRRLPHGAWWWRALVLGVLNVGAFFVLVYLAATLLPTSVAAVVMSLSPVAMLAAGWALVGERPAFRAVAGAALGILGVVVMLGGASGALSPCGVGAGVAAMAMYAVGSVLAKRWSTGVDLVASTSWQLVAGGLLLLPLALAIEGPPVIHAWSELAAFAYISFAATGVAFVAWFGALRHLRAGQVGLLGLLNPVTGVLLGVLLGGEALTGWQAAGIAAILAGVVLGQSRARRRRASAPTPTAEPAAAAR